MKDENHQQDSAPPSPAGKRGRLRLILLAAVVLALFASGLILPVRKAITEQLGNLLDWTDSLGQWGPVVVAAFYVVACVLFLPGSVLTLGAGLLFGVARGTITVSIGSTLGAVAAFLVGRTFARGWVEKKVSESPKFAAIDEAVAMEGFKIVLLTRLSPVFPFNMLNYAYGLTKVKLWKYALASWIGMLPGTVMYVYLGSGLRDVADVVAGRVRESPAQRVFFWIGLAVAVVVVVLVTRVARRALKQAVPLDARHGRQGDPHT